MSSITLLSRNGTKLAQVSKEDYVAGQLNRTPVQVGMPMTNVGTIGQLPADTLSGANVDTFSCTLENTCSAEQTYIIGDPTGLIAVQSGGTLLNPTATSADGAVKGSGVLAMKQMFGFSPIAIQGFNYECSTTPLQFAKKLQQVVADVDGQFARKPISVSAQRRNNQFDELLMTLQFPVPFTFTPKRALTLTVLPGETVSLVFDVFMMT